MDRTIIAVHRMLDALAAVLRTGATTAASATTSDRLKEMAEFYLAIREAMKSALQRLVRERSAAFESPSPHPGMNA